MSETHKPSKGPSPAVLSVARTWDGRPVSLSETATLCLQPDPRGGGLRIDVEAPFHGDAAPPGSPGPSDGLWRYEVVELFFAGGPQAPYLEFEMSPHGHYLVLRLEGPRRRRPGDPAEGLPLDFQAEILPGSGDASVPLWRGRALVPEALLPAPPERLWGNAYALHGEADTRRHLAWQPVPGAAPNFHQPGCFARFWP